MKPPKLTANQYLVLATIRTAGAISRRKIAAFTGKKKSSITHAVTHLIQHKLVHQQIAPRSQSSSGARSTLLKLNPAAAYAAGIEFTKELITFALTDFTGALTTFFQIPWVTQSPAATVSIEPIEAAFMQCIENENLNLSQISGIGITGSNLSEQHNHPPDQIKHHHLSGSELQRLLQQRFKLPIILANNAHAVTMTQTWRDPDQSIDDLMVIYLQESVGMAIFLNGQHFQSRKHYGGQWGHSVVVPGGIACRCGKNGCVEAYVGESALLRAYLRESAHNSRLTEEIDAFGVDDLIETVNQHDTVSKNIFQRAGAVLGLAISGPIQLFSPQRVFIVGKITQVGELLFTPLQEAMRHYLDDAVLNRTEICLPAWQPSLEAHGAALLVLDQVYGH